MTKETIDPKKIFSASAFKAELATLVPKQEMPGAGLTAFALIQIGAENPYKGCIVEIIDGPDAGKQFVANVGKPQRFFESLTISLLKAVEE